MSENLNTLNGLCDKGDQTACNTVKETAALAAATAWAPFAVALGAGDLGAGLATIASRTGASLGTAASAFGAWVNSQVSSVSEELSGISSSAARLINSPIVMTSTSPPQDVAEQMVMDDVVANPAAGDVLPITLGDPRFSAADGWVKMQRIVRTATRNINIHWVYNANTGAADDFKAKR